MNYNYRYATKEDAELIALINSKSALKAYKGIIPDEVLQEKFSFENMKDRLYKELNEGNTKSCIMYMDDAAVGMQTFAKDDEMERDASEIDIWRLYLLPEYWGQSLGTDFMSWGIKELSKSGYKKVALWVVEGNSRAMGFYKKCGFIHDGEVRVINPGKELKECRYTKILNER